MKDRFFDELPETRGGGFDVFAGSVGERDGDAGYDGHADARVNDVAVDKHRLEWGDGKQNEENGWKERHEVE